MLFKTLAAVSIMGTRVEKGTICDVPDQVALAFGSAYLEPVDAPQTEIAEVVGDAIADDADTTTDTEPVDARAELEALKVAELRERCTEAGLSSDGNKTDLIDRLLLANDEI